MTTCANALSCLFVLLAASSIDGFSVLPSYPSLLWRRTSTTTTTRLRIFAPPGSGYARPEDEQSELPSTYDPMMEYPGTMRPGKTPENMPFQDLPIGDNDPDPVPWPHFQQIEWHHQWEPPHEHPIPMEDFIEMHGRWATPEMEAAMRAGVRQGVRELREAEEAEKRDVIITDDEEDELDVQQDVPVALGDGVFGRLGSTADQAATAAATSPDRVEEKIEEDESFDEAGLDDFLLDLGLDTEMEDEDDLSERSSTTNNNNSRDQVSSPSGSTLDDAEEDDEDEEDISMDGVTASIDVDDDSDLDLGLDVDDELEVGGTVPLEDYGDDSDTLDTEDVFDEGGFDFDDDFGDMDGGDMW